MKGKKAISAGVDSRLRQAVSDKAKAIAKDYPEAIAAISSWLALWVPRLNQAPDWPIPKYEEFNTAAFACNAEANVGLKYFLSPRWHSADWRARDRIARWVVIKWGGIGGNSRSTLSQHRINASTAKPQLRMAGIASLSKILAIAFPDFYAVYDARVAAALAAIQVDAGVHRGIAFRYVMGRNTVIHGRRDPDGKLVVPGFVHRVPFKNLRGRNWLVPKQNENYVTYLGCLKECRKRIGNYKLAQLEFALFANAVSVCNVKAKRARGK